VKPTVSSRAVFLLASLLAVSSACGDADTSGGGGSGDDGSGAGSVPDGPPRAPYLDTVAALHGALHLFWTNETPDCDAIEGERSTEDDPFEPLFTVEGDVEDWSDDEATDPSVLYSYRLRCRRGDELSPYSNVDARSPKPDP
jgi:hypothetical protein